MQRHEPAADAAAPGTRPEDQQPSVSRLLAACAAAAAVSTPPKGPEESRAGNTGGARDGRPATPGAATVRQAA
ncbi:hypothetical protein DMH02_000545 [Streptomyces sp. WAC 00631]|uniref:hypothetical protein n=1 Tax=Streptomyces sp. WAC 00631 TaxID=2203201 RepID=UPI000F7B78D8|nr:hypothetical protein [Streptomyces sp. WAC 00631]MCC5031792.1 hypothetical protein [Streptomyces sp. WAC 00631]